MVLHVAGSAGAVDDGDGAVLLRGAVAADDCARWLAFADARFNAHGSSLRLAAVEGLDEAEVLQRVVRGTLRRHCERLLGAPLACNIDQSWLRRQFAPAHAPPGHSPHSWHQDGALRADFGTPGRAELLTMLTCWVALTPCGDRAPGLQWLAQRLPAALPPAELASDRVAQSVDASAWRQPVLAPGDALLIAADVLHRTHVTPSMTATRTSLELRLFPAARLPQRLAGERFVVLA